MKTLTSTIGKVVMLLILILACGFSLRNSGPRLASYYRVWIPYPLNYTQRLVFLEGWNSMSKDKDSLNCSGFICNAHGSRFRTSAEMYFNSLGDMTLLREVASRSQIDESLLLPGDVAAFRGLDTVNLRQQVGIHVAAYLGNGLWVDADSRRGGVLTVGGVKTMNILNPTTLYLENVPRKDHYYAGRVRLYRWNQAPKFSFTMVGSTVGRDDRSL
jgi:hypothetical protein